MGWLRTMFLGDVGNRLDIADNENRIAQMQEDQRRRNSARATKDQSQDEAIAALRGPQDCVEENVEIYRERRDALVDGLSLDGPGCWKIDKPLATMFVWARVPEPFQAMGSLEFSKRLLLEAKVAVSAGVGFGEWGEGYVRFALVENKHRIRQAVRGIRRFLRSAEA